MSTVLRRNRKGSDRDIIRYNSLGYSLSTIGDILKCHPTSITLRLKGLGIAPADTRRAFMEGVYKNLPTEYQEEIADLLEAQKITNIKDYVRNLITSDMEHRRLNATEVTEANPTTITE